MRTRDVDFRAVVFGAGDEARELSDRLSTHVPVAHFPTSPRPSRIQHAIRELEPDLLHWNLGGSYGFRGGAWIAAARGAPSVATDHIPGRPPHRPYQMMRAIANRRLGGLIFVSDAARRMAGEIWRHLPPAHVVPNGVPPGESRRREPRGQISLLFVGRLTEQKHPLFVLDVLRAARERGVDVVLRVVGDGELRAEMEQTITSSGLRPHVSMLGYRQDARSEMLAADLLLSPARREGLPFALLEALSTGLPLVVSDIDPHRELSRGSSAVALLPWRPDAWVDAIVAAPAALGQQSEEALALSRFYSSERMADETVAVYQRVMDRSR
jgi:glycosyltransferase involved in cell wall biosynthesis